MPSIATSRVTASDSGSSDSGSSVPDTIANDPWQSAEPVSSVSMEPAIAPPTPKDSSKRSPLRDSPVLPLILMLWFALVVVRAAVELTIELGVGIFALVRWGIRRYQAQQLSGENPSPRLEQLATAG